MKSLNKTYKTVVCFIIASVLLFFVQRQIVMYYIDNYNDATAQHDEIDFISKILTGLLYAFSGLLAFLAIINLTTLTGLIIAKHRKDTPLEKGFKITTVLTLITDILVALELYVL